MGELLGELFIVVSLWVMLAMLDNRLTKIIAALDRLADRIRD